MILTLANGYGQEKLCRDIRGHQFYCRYRMLILRKAALFLNGSLSDKSADSLIEIQSHIFAQGFKGITDIKVGPDGYLYILTYERPGGEGAIYRIIPKEMYL
jgi:aldose sugar dehydrogenase